MTNEEYTVEPTAEEVYRLARENGAVDIRFDLETRNATVALLVQDLKQASEWERRAENEYRNAMRKRNECFDILMRAMEQIRIVK